MEVKINVLFINSDKARQPYNESRILINFNKNTPNWLTRGNGHLNIEDLSIKDCKFNDPELVDRINGADVIICSGLVFQKKSKEIKDILSKKQNYFFFAVLSSDVRYRLNAKCNGVLHIINKQKDDCNFQLFRFLKSCTKPEYREKHSGFKKPRPISRFFISLRILFRSLVPPVLSRSFL